MARFALRAAVVGAVVIATALGAPLVDILQSDKHKAELYRVNWSDRLVSANDDTDYVNPAGKFLINLAGDGPGANPAWFMESIFVQFEPCGYGHPHVHTSPASHETIIMLSGSINAGFMRNNYSAVLFDNLQPLEQIMMPGGFVHWLSNPNCENATMLQVYSDPVTNIIYPHRVTVNLPEDVFGQETGQGAQPLGEARASHPAPARIMYGPDECYIRCGLPVPTESLNAAGR